MDNIDRLLDSIEHPDRYSEEEIEYLFADSEVKDVFDMLDKTKSALAPIQNPDVEAEWVAFKNAHPAGQRNRFRIRNLLTRNIAASIAIGIAALAAVGAVVGVSINYIHDRESDAPASSAIEEANRNVVPHPTTAVTENKVTTTGTTPETITFENEPLETIATRIADYYGYTVTFSSEAPKSLRLYFRWNRTQTLDEVVESLNTFEQINISVQDKVIKIN